MNWHYVDANGQQAGPVDDAGLDTLIATGKVTPDTLVWREGMANWQPCREARPAFAEGGPAPSAAAAPMGEEAACAECGNLFPINETIRVGSVRICAKCKPIFVQKMREGVNVEAAGTMHYAGFWKRFAAVFVDGILLYIVNSGINAAFGLPIINTGTQTNPNVSLFLIFGVAGLQLFIGLAYETFMIGKYGATLGKMACKIRVVTADGLPVSYARSLGRYFAKLVSAFTCSIGYIMAGFDPEKRALHDRICNTRVIYNQ